jgi:hypothetical protein
MVDLSRRSQLKWKGQIHMSHNVIGTHGLPVGVATADEIEVSAYAIRQTRAHGGFALEHAAEAIGLPEVVIERVVAKLSGHGHVEVGSDESIRWIDPPPPPPPRRRGRCGRPYAIEELADLLATVGNWAADWTRRMGAFTVRAVERELNMARSLAVRVLDLCVDGERAIRLDRRAGFLWSGVPVPPGRTQKAKNAPYTPEEWAALREDFEDWAKDFPNISANRICKKYMVSPGIATRLLDQLVNEGRMVRLDQQHGYAWLGHVSSSNSLETVVAAARRLEDTDHTVAPGRRRKDALLDVSCLTSSQVAQLNGLSAFIATKLGFESPSQVSLADPLFGWDSERLQWKLVERVGEWTASLPKETRYSHRGTVPLLMAVAQEAKLIQQETTSSYELYTRTHAAEWQAHIDDLGPQVVAANGGKSADGLITGLRTLARHASRRGQLSVAESDWPAIHREIDGAFNAGGMSEHSWYYSRRAYETMRGLGLVQGPAWIKETERIAFLPTSAVEAAVENLDFSGWVDAEGDPLPLVTGHYGLLGYCTWATAEAWTLRSKKLPPREFIDPNAAQRSLIASNARRGAESFLLVPDTLRTRLQHINYLLGWIDRHVDHLDVATLTLDDLCDAELVSGLGDWLRARRRKLGKADTMPSLIGALANELAVIASPFLEARAGQEEDPQRAARTRERAEILREFATAAKKKVRSKKDIKKIARAWRGKDRLPGWIKLLRLRDLLIADIEKLGGCSIEEQAERLLRGELTVDSRWAAKVRAAVLVNVVRLIPLRRRALSGLTMDMWENIPVLDDEHGRKLELWEGAIILNVPGELMKSGRDFDPAYIAEARVGRRRQEYGAARSLLCLWFAADGARDEMRRLPDGTMLDSPFLFPVMARMALNGDAGDRDRLVARQCRWDGESVSETFANLVMEYGDALHVDLPALIELGGLRIHIARLLFGTYMAPRNLLMASRLLDHRDVNFTARVYCGEGVREATREVPLKMIPTRA